MVETSRVPIKEDRVMAALAYPFWFVVFPLVYVTPDKRFNPFLRFHAYQGAAIGLFGFVGLSFVRAVLSLLFRWMIVVDVLLYPLLHLAEWAVLLVAGYGMVMAALGRYTNLPYLSQAIRQLWFEDENPPR